MHHYLKRYPITSLLFGINAAYFVYTLLSGGFSPQHLADIGGFYPAADGEYSRYITGMFLHGGVLHFAMNMIMLIQFANSVEEWVGKGFYLLLYLISGIGANLATAWFSDPYTVTVGASGALYGIFGFYLFLALFKRNWLPHGFAQQITQLIAFNLILTFVIPNISMTAHIGGLITGFILSAIIVPIRQRKWGR